MTTIKLRRGTAAEWSEKNPVLHKGEPGFEIDTGHLKIGDGRSRWSELSSFVPTEEQVDELTAVIRDYRGVPYRDPRSGEYLPRGFDRALSTPQATTRAIQAAIEAAAEDGGGVVRLTEKYDLAPSEEVDGLCLYLQSGVALVGAAPQSATLRLSDGAAARVLGGKGVLDSSGAELSTYDVTLWGFTIDGNLSRQPEGDSRADLHALDLVRFPGLRWGFMDIRDVAGRGFVSTGGSTRGVGGTRTTRPLWEGQSRIFRTNAAGFYSSATNRETFSGQLHVEECGQAGGEPAVFLDHSEDNAMQILVRRARGDGIYIHNVQLSDYSNLAALACGGFGIVVMSMVSCSGRAWRAHGNCQDPAAVARAELDGVAYRRVFSQSAEVAVGSSGSYGNTRDTVIESIHAPTFKQFGGPSDDNVYADYGLVIDRTVEDSFLVSHHFSGDGGRVGALLDLR